MRMVVVLVFMLIASTAGAATLESKAAARKLTDDIMKKVGSGEMESGLLLMKPYSMIPESEYTVMMEQVKLQLPSIIGRYGKAIGSEFLREKAVGRSLLQIVHIQKFENTVMRWNFIFYSPDGRWALNSFNFDDKVYLLFED